MKIFDGIDEQVLNAFVDSQLDAETSEAIIKEMDKNADIRDYVYQLRRAKDLIKLGFGTADAPEHAPAQITNKTPNHSRRHHYTFSMVASFSVIAITISLCSGAFGFYFAKQELIQAAIESSLHNATQQTTQRILLHISESDTQHFSAALNYAEKFLREHENTGAQIAVVANAGGLDLMRAGISPYEKKIRSMMKNHDNIYFIACANTIRFLYEKGVDLKLIDNVQVNKPALDHIVDFVREGWEYKKVDSLVKI